MTINTLRQTLKQLRQQQAQNFLNNVDSQRLFIIQTEQTDQIIQHLLQHLKLDQSTLNLFAIGGYGQQELYPYSDLDLLLLYDQSLAASAEKIHQFVCMLWDIGFTPKLITHDLSGTIKQAHEDLIFYTSLLSLRLLQGNPDIFNLLRRKIYSDELWPKQNFFTARILQRKQELEKYHAMIAPTVYNIKLHPGGLRDFHCLRWLSQKFSHSDNWQFLVKNIISIEMQAILKNNLEQLQTLRFALQLLQENDTNLLTQNSVNNNPNYFKLFLNSDGQNNNFFDPLKLQFEAMTQNNYELIRQICSHFTGDFSRHP